FTLDFGDANLPETKAPGYFDFKSFGFVKPRPRNGGNDLRRHAIAILPPTDRLGDAAAALGYVNTIPETRTQGRSEVMAIKLGEDFYASLSIAPVARYLGKEPDEITLNLSSPVGNYDIEIADRRIPINDEAKTVVNYYGPAYTFKPWSLADVVAKR